MIERELARSVLLEGQRRARSPERRFRAELRALRTHEARKRKLEVAERRIERLTEQAARAA